MDSPILLNPPGALRAHMLKEEEREHRLAREAALRKMVEERGEG
jgi:hypothetical protein